MVSQIAILVAWLVAGMQFSYLLFQLVDDFLVQLALLFLLLSVLYVVEMELVERLVRFFQSPVVDVQYDGGEDERYQHHVGTEGHNAVGKVGMVVLMIIVGKPNECTDRYEIE